MALNKVTYTDDVTVVEAQNLNDIQDAIIAMETVPLVAVNSDLDTIQTPGRYRLWGAYTNAPKTGNIYGILTVDGVSGALIQTYQSATATDSYFRGYTNAQWYPWKQFMIDSGGTFKGTVYIDREDGTTSATGTSTLWVGNNTPTGTAGNSKGQVVIYGNGANYVNIQASNATGNRTVELPDANGTIAIQDRILKQEASVEVVGNPTGWVYKNITFPTPFIKQPLVSVSFYGTSYATDWTMPMIANVTATGFQMGWWQASGTKNVYWQAFGII